MRVISGKCFGYKNGWLETKEIDVRVNREVKQQKQMQMQKEKEKEKEKRQGLNHPKQETRRFPITL